MPGSENGDGDVGASGAFACPGAFVCHRYCGRAATFPVENVEPSRKTRDLLTHQYRRYLALVRGVLSNRLDVPIEWDADMNKGLHVYATQYLPNEILSWGGDVRVMFPKMCDVLDQCGISLNQFVEFWFAHPRKSRDLSMISFCSKLMYLWNFSVRCFLWRVPLLNRKPIFLLKATSSRLRGHRRNYY